MCHKADFVWWDHPTSFSEWKPTTTELVYLARLMVETISPSHLMRTVWIILVHFIGALLRNGFSHTSSAS
jgi:hypothetical protein